jgi:hypothetical protein
MIVLGKRTSMRKFLGCLGVIVIVLVAGFCGLRLLPLGSLISPDYRKLAMEGQSAVQWPPDCAALPAGLQSAAQSHRASVVASA